MGDFFKDSPPQNIEKCLSPFSSLNFFDAVLPLPIYKYATFKPEKWPILGASICNTWWNTIMLLKVTTCLGNTIKSDHVEGNLT